MCKLFFIFLHYYIIFLCLFFFVIWQYVITCLFFCYNWTSELLFQLISCIHCLNGSALGDGIDCINLNSWSISATSVFRIFPSAAGSFKALQFVTVSFPSFLRRFFNTLQYVCGLSLSVNTETTSTIEKYHFPRLHSKLCVPFGRRII